MSFAEAFLTVTVMLVAATIPAGIIAAGALWLVRVVESGFLFALAVVVWTLTVLSTSIWALCIWGPV